MSYANRAKARRAAEMRDVYQKNPVAFIRDVLGCALWSIQADICEAIVTHRTTVVASCHAIGKSYLSARIALWFLLNFPGSKVITTAPTMRQVKQILWSEIAAAVRSARFKIVPDDVLTTSELKLGKEWFAVGFTTREGDATRFQGYHAPYVLVIGDEAAGLDETTFTGIDAVLSGGFARLLLPGNPTDPLSQFAKYFTMDGVAKFNVSAFDTPNFTTFGITLDDIRNKTWKAKITGDLPYPALINPEWVAEKYAQWCGGSVSGESNPLWCARIMGQFPANARDQLVPLQWIIEAQQRTHEAEDIAKVDNAKAEKKPANEDEENLIAADIARMGGDEIVIGHRKAWRFKVKEAFTHALLTETAGRIGITARDCGTTKIRGDVIGVGGGALDILREQGFEVTDVNVAMRASDPERFTSFRDEMYWQLREKLNPELGSKMQLDPLDDVLAAQLSSIKYKVMSNGKIKVESKDEMKARGLSSPDRADCAAIAFCDPPLEPIGFVFAGQAS